MILLGSRGSERLVFKELMSWGGLQPAGWGISALRGGSLTGESAVLKVACKSQEFPPTSFAYPGHSKKMCFFTSMSSRQGVSTPLPQVLMWRARGRGDGQFLSCRPL